MGGCWHGCILGEGSMCEDQLWQWGEVRDYCDSAYKQSVTEVSHCWCACCCCCFSPNFTETYPSQLARPCQTNPSGPSCCRSLSFKGVLFQLHPSPSTNMHTCGQGTELFDALEIQLLSLCLFFLQEKHLVYIS